MIQGVDGENQLMILFLQKKYDKLHILTHAFWYKEAELDIGTRINEFVNHANVERYAFFKENITDLESIMKEEEVLHG